jgi:hypothetical protein
VCRLAGTPAKHQTRQASLAKTVIRCHFAQTSAARHGLPAMTTCEGVGVAAADLWHLCFCGTISTQFMSLRLCFFSAGGGQGPSNPQYTQHLATNHWPDDRTGSRTQSSLAVRVRRAGRVRLTYDWRVVPSTGCHVETGPVHPLEVSVLCRARRRGGPKMRRGSGIVRRTKTALSVVSMEAEAEHKAASDVPGFLR